VLTAGDGVTATFARHVNPTFVRMLDVLGFGRVFRRAEDVWLWDEQDRRYLDALAGFGAVNIGHNHPRLIRRLQTLLAEGAPGLVHTGPAVEAAELAQTLAARLGPGLEISLFTTSGAEAVDAALKLAHAATGRPGVVYCRGGFHGLTLGTLGVMGASRLRTPFERRLPQATAVDFGDLPGLEAALASRRVAAFVVEPIQAEGGVVLPPHGYLAAAHALCRQRGTLLVLDEVQTGIGRTGALCAHTAEGVVPDVLVLAKALGGGVAPVGVAVTSADLHHAAYGALDRFDLHGSTFAGYALGCVAARETLAILDDESLAANAAARGAQLMDALRRVLGRHPLVRDVRGRGLLVGIELGLPATVLARLVAGSLRRRLAGIFGQWAALKMLERSVVCQPASLHWNVLRLEPPLTIRAPEVEQLATAVATVLDEYHDARTLLADVAARAGRRWLARRSA
jgi:putrescine aminotransferase